MHLRQRRECALSEAFEIVTFGDSPILITCEHASATLPEGWSWSDRDRRLRSMHWAVDLGAADLSRELAAELETSAVLAQFSRLLVDPNRQLASPTLFRAYCDGIAVDLNRELAPSDRQARLNRFYRPFHAAVEDEMARVERRLVFSIHSFTPEYEGRLRAVTVGVLFDEDSGPAHALRDLLARGTGHAVALNEPWSGANGLMYSAQTHANQHDAIALEIEVRQDLLVDPAFRAMLVPALASALQELVA